MHQRKNLPTHSRTSPLRPQPSSRDPAQTPMPTSRSSTKRLSRVVVVLRWCRSAAPGDSPSECCRRHLSPSGRIRTCASYSTPRDSHSQSGCQERVRLPLAGTQYRTASRPEAVPSRARGVPIETVPSPATFPALPSVPTVTVPTIIPGAVMPVDVPTTTSGHQFPVLREPHILFLGVRAAYGDL